MRSFLRTLLCFAIAPVLYCLIMAVLNLRTMVREPLPVHARMLLLGDSHIGCSLDTTVLHDAQNIALPAEPYLLSLYKLEHILHERSIDTLLLGFAPHNLSDKDHRKFREAGWATERLMKRIYPLMPPGDALRLPFHIKTYTRTLFMQFCVAPRPTHVHYIGSFSGLRANYHADSASTYERHFGDAGGQVAPISEFGIACLDSIVSLSQRAHITLYLIGTPLHSSYRRNVPAAYQERYTQLIERYSAQGVHVIDGTAMFSGDSLFANSDHLNAKGARRFSRYIRSVLQGTNDVQDTRLPTGASEPTSGSAQRSAP